MKQLLTENTVLGTAVQVLPFAVLVAALCTVLRIGSQKRKGKAIRPADEALRAVFTLYCAALFALLLTPANFWASLWHTILYGGAEWDRRSFGAFNFVPTFWKILTGEYVMTGWGWVGEMLTLNALLFVPMGLYLRLAAHRAKSAKPLLCGILVPPAVELLQPLIGRSFDIDDLLLNLLGFLLGCCLMSLFLIPFRRRGKTFGKN